MANLSAASGHADAEDDSVAGRRAVVAALEEVETVELVLLFVSGRRDPTAVLSGASAATVAPIVGCTTAGEIADDDAHMGTVVALALGGDGLEVAVGVGTGIGEDERAAGTEAAREVLDGVGEEPIETTAISAVSGEWRSYPTVQLLAFGCGLAGDNQAVLAGVQDVVGSTAVVGGWAADDWSLEETYVFADGKVLTDAIVLACLSVDVRTGTCGRHGLTETEREFTVTAAEGPWVYELDGRPALEVYRGLYGKRATNPQFLLSKPLAIDTGETEPRVREPIAVDEDSDAIEYSEVVEEGWTVGLIDASPEQILEGVEVAVDCAMAEAGGPDDVAAVLVHDCACRWVNLTDSETRRREIESIRERVGEDTPIVGWYTYGEIVAPGSLNGVRHQNVVVQVLSNERL